MLVHRHYVFMYVLNYGIQNRTTSQRDPLKIIVALRIIPSILDSEGVFCFVFFFLLVCHWFAATKLAFLPLYGAVIEWNCPLGRGVNVCEAVPFSLEHTSEGPQLWTFSRNAHSGWKMGVLIPEGALKHSMSYSSHLAALRSLSFIK